MKRSGLNITSELYVNPKNFKINKVILHYGHILFLYSLYAFLIYDDGLGADQERYIEHANNLLNGFYSPPYPNITLWSGPGYPLVLMPIIGLGLGKPFIVMLNVLFLFSSVILLHVCVLRVTKSEKSAYLSGNAWGFYYISYRGLSMIWTEPFTIFLIILLTFCYLKASYENNKYYFSLSGLTLGYLILTKVIFFYVVIPLALLAVLGYFFSNQRYKVNYLVFVMAGIIITPYLLYTYSLAGKFPYLSSHAGENIYWMSNPNEYEFGDANDFSFRINCGGVRSPCNSHLFELNHGEFFKSFSQLDSMSIDDELQKKAFSNIVSHPTKYIRNYIQNISRLLFNSPNSYYYQQETTFYRIVPNAIVLTLFIFVLGLIFFKHQVFDRNIRDVFCFVFMYLAVSGLVSVDGRQFYVIVPELFLVFSYSLNRFISIRHE